MLFRSRLSQLWQQVKGTGVFANDEQRMDFSNAAAMYLNGLRRSTEATASNVPGTKHVLAGKEEPITKILNGTTYEKRGDKWFKVKK